MLTKKNYKCFKVQIGFLMVPTDFHGCKLERPPQVLFKNILPYANTLWFRCVSILFSTANCITACEILLFRISIDTVFWEVIVMGWKKYFLNSYYIRTSPSEPKTLYSEWTFTKYRKINNRDGNQWFTPKVCQINRRLNNKYARNAAKWKWI